MSSDLRTKSSLELSTSASGIVIIYQPSPDLSVTDKSVNRMKRPHMVSSHQAELHRFCIR
jgi:hypothetical protein